MKNYRNGYSYNRTLNDKSGVYVLYYCSWLWLFWADVLKLDDSSFLYIGCENSCLNMAAGSALYVQIKRMMLNTVNWLKNKFHNFRFIFIVLHFDLYTLIASPFIPDKRIAWKICIIIYDRNTLVTLIPIDF